MRGGDNVRGRGVLGRMSGVGEERGERKCEGGGDERGREQTAEADDERGREQTAEADDAWRHG